MKLNILDFLQTPKSRERLAKLSIKITAGNF